MKLSVNKPVVIHVGMERTTVLPHQRVSIADALGKKLLKLHSDVLRRVR